MMKVVIEIRMGGKISERSTLALFSSFMDLVIFLFSNRGGTSLFS
jgi:hypothetical protein